MRARVWLMVLVACGGNAPGGQESGDEGSTGDTGETGAPPEDVGGPDVAPDSPADMPMEPPPDDCGFTPVLGRALDWGSARVMADFDQDGAEDLAVKDHIDDAVRLYWGEPDSFAFEEGPEVAIASGLEMDVGDFDGDGYPDLLHGWTTMGGGPWVQFNVDGTLSPGIEGGLPIYLDVLNVRDSNADGRDDVVIDPGGHLPAQARESNGDGSFALLTEFSPIVCGVMDGKWADYDQDTRLDFALVAGCDGPLEYPVGSVFLQKQDQVWTEVEPGPETQPGYSRCLYTAQLDGDDVPDLAICESGEYTLEIHLGSGDGTFAPPSIEEDVSEVMTIADIDGDGDEDILIRPDLVLLRNDGDANFERCVLSYDSERFWGFADLDGDDKPEILTSVYVDAVRHLKTWVRDD